MPLSPFELISKGRRLLSEEFEAGNMDEVRRIMNYLDAKVDESGNLSLWNNERMMLYYWTKEYDKIILFSIQPKIGYSVQPTVYPPDDGLNGKIIDKTGENLDRLSEDLTKKNFSDDTNSFLRLLLMRLLLDRAERFVTLEQRIVLSAQSPAGTALCLDTGHSVYCVVPAGLWLCVYLPSCP